MRNELNFDGFDKEGISILFSNQDQGLSFVLPIVIIDDETGDDFLLTGDGEYFHEADQEPSVYYIMAYEDENAIVIVLDKATDHILYTKVKQLEDFE